MSKKIELEVWSVEERLPPGRINVLAFYGVYSAAIMFVEKVPSGAEWCWYSDCECPTPTHWAYVPEVV